MEYFLSILVNLLNFKYWKNLNPFFLKWYSITLLNDKSGKKNTVFFGKNLRYKFIIIISRFLKKISSYYE